MNIDIVRAWKDAEYRESLSDEELAQVPEHPAGEVELDEEELVNIAGGSVGVCTLLSLLVCYC